MRFYIFLFIGAILISATAYYTYLQYKEEKHSMKLLIITLVTCLLGAISTIVSNNDSKRNEKAAIQNAIESKRNDSLYKSQLNKNLNNSYVLIDSVNKNLRITNDVLKYNNSIIKSQSEARKILSEQLRSSAKAIREIDRQNTQLRDIAISFTISYPIYKQEYSVIDSLIENYNEGTGVSATSYVSISKKGGKKRTKESGRSYKRNYLEVINKTDSNGKTSNQILFYYTKFDRIDGLYKYVRKIPKFYLGCSKVLPGMNASSHDYKFDILYAEANDLPNENYGEFNFVEFDLKQKVIKQYVKIYMTRLNSANNIISIRDIQDTYISIFSKEYPTSASLSEFKILYGENYSNYLDLKLKNSSPYSANLSYGTTFYLK